MESFLRVRDRQNSAIYPPISVPLDSRITRSKDQDIAILCWEAILYIIYRGINRQLLIRRQTATCKVTY